MFLTVPIRAPIRGNGCQGLADAAAGNLDSKPVRLGCGEVAAVGECAQNIAHDGGSSRMTISRCGGPGLFVDFESVAAISNKIDSIHHAAEN
jgi:hypothetical protein